jgi:sulfur carrier protein
VLTVHLNGEALLLDAPLTIAALVERQTGRAKPVGVAVARNREVVPRGAWDDVRVEDGDEIELVGVMQGG